ncbi:YitT family protein [Sulfurospirillum arcachonense]|uniref:YitT family protein n=1 Tax=Sulfurospirillum arcachonense TaxID=57666 RepID=UPI00046892B6|nr:YitT family protein [Sulfurospirillum arcachonense]
MQFKQEIKNYTFLSLGSFFVALGVVLFFITNNITTGGTPGAAILLHHFTGYSVGTMMIVLNIPLLMIGIKYIGKQFAIRTIVTIVLTSFCVDFLSDTLNLTGLTQNIFLSTVFGGALIGLGVGFMFQGNSSAGGSSIVAKVICANSEIKHGQVILFIDVIIVLSSIYIFKDVEKALWSLVSIYVTSRCIDVFLSGNPSKKVVHLVSDKTEEISEKIIQKLGNYGSIVNCTGLHVDEPKRIIFIVVELSRLRVLRELIKETDPDAFMVVMDASELLGRGH